MKTILEHCSRCGEETTHDAGKKLSHKGDKHHIRRSTRRCRRCGTREISSRMKGKKIITGKNELPMEETI